MGIYTLIMEEELEDEKDKEEKLNKELEDIDEIEESFNFTAEMVPVHLVENNTGSKFYVEFAQLKRFMDFNNIGSIKEATDEIINANKEENSDIEDNISVTIDPEDIKKCPVEEMVSLIKEAKEDGVKLFKSKFDMYNGAKIDDNIAKLEKAIEDEQDEDKKKELEEDLKKLKEAKEKFEANKKK